MRGSWRVFVAFRITRPFEFTIGEPRPRILLKRTFQTICHHEKLKTKDVPTWERSLHGQTLSLPHRRRSVCRFVVLRIRRRLPVPQPMLLAHRSGAVRYRKNTFRHYLHYPSDRLTGVVIPRKLRELLRLYVILVKRLPATQVADCLHEFYCRKGQFPDTSHRHGRM